MSEPKPFYVYYDMRFAHWLTIPVQRDVLGSTLDVTQEDISNDFRSFFLPEHRKSRPERAPSGQPEPFIDRLD